MAELWNIRSLEHGANPNATCRLDMVSACHLAAAMGSEQILAMLINRGAERNRMDRRGRTPLHLAAWGGHNKFVAILLHFPESLQRRLDGVLSQQTEREVRYCASQLRSDLVNVRCVATEERAQLPKDWKDSFDHECKDVMGVIPLIGDGWTPLHVAAAGAQPDSTQLLLLAGGDVHAHDQRARTPLDVLGAAFYHQPDQIDAEKRGSAVKMPPVIKNEAGDEMQQDAVGCATQAVIKNADMGDEMQQYAVDCAMQALETFEFKDDIASFIQKEFNKKYYPAWQCIVGRNFGSSVTHETGHFIYFYMGHRAILLFKSH